MVQHCRINLQNETFEPQFKYKLLDNPDGNKLLESYLPFDVHIDNQLVLEV